MRRRLTETELYERLTLGQREQPQTLRLERSRELDSRISREDEKAISAAARESEAAAKATADLNRDTRFARRASKLALEVDRLDKDMRAAGVDRDVYRQVAHAVRALQVGMKLLRDCE